MPYRPYPLAYFLTWHTYGTWLHGDDRGSVDRENNLPGTPMLTPNEPRLAQEARMMGHPRFTLGDIERSVVEQAFHDHCRHRDWELCAVAARTNHVHVVVRHAGVSPEVMMGQLKSWATRRLREAGCVSCDQRVWVHHGSTRYLWDAPSVEAAMTYVEIGQDDPR